MNLERAVSSHRCNHCIKLVSGAAQRKPVAPQQLTLAFLRLCWPATSIRHGLLLCLILVTGRFDIFSSYFLLLSGFVMPQIGFLLQLFRQLHLVKLAVNLAGHLSAAFAQPHILVISLAAQIKTHFFGLKTKDLCPHWKQM